MEHEKLDLDYDKTLINKILDNVDNRYIILFLYIIRNDFLQDLNDKTIIDSYEKVLVLDDIYKENITMFWPKEFIEIAIDLGLFKNIRSIKEFENKENDFIIKLGEETVTIENNVILIPDDTLFNMITKKFKFFTRRNFNSALTRLKSVLCEKSSMIHPFILQIGENDYTLTDDLFYILEQYGNIYQAIKMEITIEGFYKRFEEISTKLTDFISVFDSGLNAKTTIKKINVALKENKDIFKFLKEEKIKLSDKFDWKDIDKNAQIFKDWNALLLKLLTYRSQMEKIEKKLLDIKSYYSGKNKKYSYLKFIEKVSYNEDNIVNEIQDSLITLRKKIIETNDEISELTKKQVKLMNLDFERFVLTS
ncbi:MAG: hypothetical protein ACFFBP_02190 [Promethearchaeota archaeon]